MGEERQIKLFLSSIQPPFVAIRIPLPYAQTCFDILLTIRYEMTIVHVTILDIIGLNS